MTNKQNNKQAIQLVEQYIRHREGLSSENMSAREIAQLACELDMACMWMLAQD